MAPNKESKNAMLQAARIMDHRGASTQDVADKTGAAYNTILSYKRDSSERFSRQVLGDMAGALNVQVWELFYSGEYARPLVKIAKALGIDATIPVTSDEYKALYMAIGQKVGAQIEPQDFESLAEQD